MNWYLEALKKYAEFNGRARRKEYWMFTLFWVLFYVAALAVDMVILSAAGIGFPVLTVLYYLGTILPNLAVAVRRLHDTDKTGWLILLGAIPLIGGLILLVFMVQEGTRGRNQYGRDPKARGRRDEYYGDYEDDDEEEEERPRSRRRAARDEDDDEDDRPRSRRQTRYEEDDDEDEDDRPRRRPGRR